MSSCQLESQSGRYGLTIVMGRSARDSIRTSRQSRSTVDVVVPARKMDVTPRRGAVDGASTSWI